MQARFAWQALMLREPLLARPRCRRSASRGSEYPLAPRADSAYPRGFLPGTSPEIPRWFPEPRHPRSRHRDRTYLSFRRRRVREHEPPPEKYPCTWDRLAPPDREPAWPPDESPALQAGGRGSAANNTATEFSRWR